MSIEQPPIQTDFPAGKIGAHVWGRWFRLLREEVNRIAAFTVDYAWSAITGKPDTFPPDPHTHSQYLTAETDPTVPTYVKRITTGDLASWASAYLVTSTISAFFKTLLPLTSAPAVRAALDASQRCPWNQYETVTQTGIVTQQSLAGAGRGSRAIPAGRLNEQGLGVELYCCGYYSTDVVPGDMTLRVMIGGNAYRTFGPFALDKNITNGFWRFFGHLSCRTTGATGTLGGQLVWEHQGSSVAGSEVLHIEDAGSVADVVMDLESALEFDVDVTTTDAGTEIACSCFTIQYIGG